MEVLIKRKDEGLKFIQQEKHDQAITKFTEVIDGISSDAEKDEDIVLKCVCLLNRSMCYMFKNEMEKSLADANAIFEIYNKKRPEEELKKNPEKMATDPLVPILALAYIRRGQLFELRGELLDALQEYALSTSLKIDDESQNGMKRILKNVGIPEIDQTDEQLRPFAFMLLHFLNENVLMAAINDLIKYIKETELSEELVKKFNETGVGRILIGIIQIYMEKEILVVYSLAALGAMAQKGIGDVFNGFPVIRLVMDKWKNNANVIGEAIKFISMSPMELYPYMARADFVTPVCDALTMELKEDEFESCFYVLFQLASEPRIVTQMASEDIIDKIFEKKSNSSFMLLTKATQLKDVAVIASGCGAVEWAFEKLADEDSNIVDGALVVLANMFIATELKPETAALAIDKVWPVVRASTKNNYIMSNGFAVLALCASKAPEKVKEHKIVIASSTILAMHKNEGEIVQNIVTFMYEVAEGGLLSEITGNRAVLPTIMSLLKPYAAHQAIIERAVAIAVHCEHPNRETLVLAGLKDHPESTILRPFIDSLKIKIPLPE